MFYILKFLGLAPYRFDRENFSFKMDLNNYITLVVSILVWVLMARFQLKNFSQKNYETGVQSKLLDHLWRYIYMMQPVLAVMSVIYNFSKIKNVEKFMKSIFNFDHIIEKFDWNVKVKHSKYPALVALIFSCFITVGYSLTTVYVFKIYEQIVMMNEPFKTLRNVTYVAVHAFYVMLSMQYILSTYCVYTRLHALIQNIR